MIVSAKKLLFKIFGLKGYLKIINKGFFFLYHAGALKNNPTFDYHYYIKNLINEGDYVLDIGANLGYYTKLFAKWVGNNGKVIAVEPIKVYTEIIKWNTKSYKNVELLPFALGTEEKKITLVTPEKYGYLRTGLPYIYEKNNNKAPEDFEFSFEAEMKQGSRLFEHLPRLNYIKCDVEGYEKYILPEMEKIIARHKPIVQVETGAENRHIIIGLMKNLRYETFVVEKKELIKYDENNPLHNGDLIFIQKSN